MKTKLILTFLLCISQFSNAQKYQVNKATISTSIPIPLSLQKGAPLTANSLATPLVIGEYLTEIGKVGDDIFFTNAAGAIISMKEYQCEKDMDDVKGKWGFGILTLPIKVRLEGGSDVDNTKRYNNFESGFNLGLVLTRRFGSLDIDQIKKYFFFSVNSSQVNITPETTNQFISSEQSNIAFSPTTGFIFELKNDLQFIAAIGIDYLSGEVGSKWVYKNKPFFGIGIGISAFKFGDTN